MNCSAYTVNAACFCEKHTVCPKPKASGYMLIATTLQQIGCRSYSSP